MNCKRDSHGSLVLGGKIYAVGGRCGISSNSVLNSVECFSPKSGRWELTASLPTSRQSYAMASLNDSFDPGANQVQDLAPMTYRCGFTGGAVLDGLRTYIQKGLLALSNCLVCYMRRCNADDETCWLQLC
eukprot:g24287.t1